MTDSHSDTVESRIVAVELSSGRPEEVSKAVEKAIDLLRQGLPAYEQRELFDALIVAATENAVEGVRTSITAGLMDLPVVYSDAIGHVLERIATLESLDQYNRDAARALEKSKNDAAVLERQLELDPHNKDVYDRLVQAKIEVAKTYYYGNMLELAINEIRDVLNLAPSEPWATEHLTKAGFDLLPKPDSPSRHAPIIPFAAVSNLRKAISHISLDEYLEAQELLDEAIKLAKDAGVDYEAAINMRDSLPEKIAAANKKKAGDEALEQGRWQEAVGQFDVALRLDPYDPVTTAKRQALDQLIDAEGLLSRFQTGYLPDRILLEQVRDLRDRQLPEIGKLVYISEPVREIERRVTAALLSVGPKYLAEAESSYQCAQEASTAVEKLRHLEVTADSLHRARLSTGLQAPWTDLLVEIETCIEKLRTAVDAIRRYQDGLPRDVRHTTTKIGQWVDCTPKDAVLGELRTVVETEEEARLFLRRREWDKAISRYDALAVSDPLVMKRVTTLDTLVKKPGALDGTRDRLHVFEIDDARELVEALAVADTDPELRIPTRSLTREARQKLQAWKANLKTRTEAEIRACLNQDRPEAVVEICNHVDSFNEIDEIAPTLRQEMRELASNIRLLQEIRTTLNDLRTKPYNLKNPLNGWRARGKLSRLSGDKYLEETKYYRETYEKYTKATNAADSSIVRYARIGLLLICSGCLIAFGVMCKTAPMGVVPTPVVEDNNRFRLSLETSEFVAFGQEDTIKIIVTNLTGGPITLLVTPITDPPTHPISGNELVHRFEIPPYDTMSQDHTFRLGREGKGPGLLKVEFDVAEGTGEAQSLKLEPLGRFNSERPVSIKITRFPYKAYREYLDMPVLIMSIVSGVLFVLSQAAYWVLHGKTK